MYPSVKEVIAGEDYNLSLVFDNGENGILDMKPMLISAYFSESRIMKLSGGFALPSTLLNGSAGSTSIRSMFMQDVRRLRPNNSACTCLQEVSSPEAQNRLRDEQALEAFVRRKAET